jgi:hypothetical protein
MTQRAPVLSGPEPIYAPIWPRIADPDQFDGDFVEKNRTRRTFIQAQHRTIG